jgi:hypothetical protein
MINIVTCAYRSARFAEDHVAFIAKQKGDYTHWVGVDGCEETLIRYKALMHPKMRLFYSKKNVGKALMQNSLVAIIGAGEKILFFDSDDYMVSGTLERLPEVYHPQVYCLPMRNSDEVNRVKPGTAIMLMQTETYFHMGGFRTEYLCGHDSCFRSRYEKVFNRKVQMLENCPAFIRNRHPESLTMRPDTSLKSEYRRWVRDFVRNEINLGHWIVEYKSLHSLTEILRCQRK